MSNSRLSLLVLMCLVGIALTLRWYLAAESRALAATRPPIELEVERSEPAEADGLPVEPVEATASRPTPGPPPPADSPRRASSAESPQPSTPRGAGVSVPCASASFVQ
jgi:hypothetical protein